LRKVVIKMGLFTKMQTIKRIIHKTPLFKGVFKLIFISNGRMIIRFTGLPVSIDNNDFLCYTIESY
jgi:hypothetical protein